MTTWRYCCYAFSLSLRICVRCGTFFLYKVVPLATTIYYASLCSYICKIIRWYLHFSNYVNHATSENIAHPCTNSCLNSNFNCVDQLNIYRDSWTLTSISSYICIVSQLSYFSTPLSTPQKRSCSLILRRRLHFITIWYQLVHI